MRTVPEGADNARDELTRVLGYCHELLGSKAFAWLSRELELEERDLSRRAASGIENQFEYWRTVGAVRHLRRFAGLVEEFRVEANTRLVDLGVDI